MNYSPSLFDLLSPGWDAGAPAEHSPYDSFGLDLNSYVPPLTEEPEGPQGSWSISQPDGMTRLANRFIGNDRYQDFGEESRRRATIDALMAMGQSLSAASMANNYGDMGQLALSGLGRSKDAFEKRLAGEQQMVDQNEDREWQRESRGNAREDREFNEAERKKQEAYRKEMNSLAKEKVKETRDWANKYGGSLGPKAEAERADLRTKLDLIDRTIKADMPVTPEQIGSVLQSRQKIYDLSPEGQRAEIDQEVAMDLYKTHKKTGKPIEEIAAMTAKAYGVELNLQAIRLANAQLELEQNKAQSEGLKRRDDARASLPPDQQRLYDLTGNLGRPSEGPKVKYDEFLKSDEVKELAAGGLTEIDGSLAVLLDTYNIPLGKPVQKVMPDGTKVMAHEVTPDVISAVRAELKKAAGTDGGAPSSGGESDPRVKQYAIGKGFLLPDGSPDIEKALAELRKQGYPV